MNNKAEALMPCPFCGGEARLKHQGNNHLKKRVSIIECSTFGCFATQRVGTLTQSGFDWTDKHVIARWNTRKGCAEVAREAVESHQTNYIINNGVADEDVWNGAISIAIEAINKAFGVSDE